MVKSMTAFAREDLSSESGELVWEVRSVNHRFLEPSIRLPEDLRALEPAVRERLTGRLQRGKVDCTLRYVARPGAMTSLTVNHHLLRQLIAVGDEVAVALDQAAALSVADLLRWPGLLQEPARDLDEVMSTALSLLDRTLDGLIAARQREGARLMQLIAARCDELERLVEQVRARLPDILAEFRQRLLDRLTELRAELDASRLEQEVVMIAQRIDVAEELDRIAAHVAEIRDVCRRPEAIGRRLDFLMQELNREANTLGSKSVDVATTRAAVDMKVLVEQMREQVQNVE
ncbi:YicC/YloC family endoribonuclease [Thioalkalicoccus limnaeus]|uniref:YicC/YloC family endoribonuclease n=1 Tax=Thioalkalicoccus limnaeus TaxID=120681 RepID=A0ABV4BA44_9GAMM